MCLRNWVKFPSCAATVYPDLIGVKAGKLATPYSRARKMSIQENLRVSETFVRSWRQNPARIEPEVISLSNETNRRPDRYFLELSNTGQLVDPETRQPVKINTQSYLGKKEFEIFGKLQNSVQALDEGNFVWISPEYSGRYPCTKVIFHQIAYKLNGDKALLCSAILCNLSGAAVLEIADNLDGQKHKDIEELRSKLFFTDEEKLISLWEKLSEFQNLKPSFLFKSEIEYYAGRIRSGDNPSAIVQEMAHAGIIGEHSISCATGQSNTFSELIVGRTITPEVGNICRKCGTMVGVACGWCKECWERYGIIKT